MPLKCRRRQEWNSWMEGLKDCWARAALAKLTDASGIWKKPSEAAETSCTCRRYQQWSRISSLSLRRLFLAKAIMSRSHTRWVSTKHHATGRLYEFQAYLQRRRQYCLSFGRACFKRLVRGTRLQEHSGKKQLSLPNAALAVIEVQKCIGTCTLL